MNPQGKKVFRENQGDEAVQWANNADPSEQILKSTSPSMHEPSSLSVSEPNAETVVQTLARLTKNANAISRLTNAQTKNADMLKELNDMKGHLCELNKNLPSAKIEGSVFAVEESPIASLKYIRQTVESFLSRRNNVPSNTAVDMLTSVLEDVDKVMNLLGTKANEKVCSDTLEITARIFKIIQTMKPDEKFENFQLENGIAIIMNEVLQAEVTEPQNLDRIARLLARLESEFCKQRSCEIQQSGLGTNDGTVFPECCAAQTNDNQCNASLNETPELLHIVTQLQNFIKCMKPDMRFITCDLQSVILCSLEALKIVIESTSPNAEALRKINDAVRCLKSELCKQCQVPSTLIAKITDMQKMIAGRISGEVAYHNGAEQYSVGRTVTQQNAALLKPTRLLTCLLKHLENWLRSIRPDLQFLSDDLDSNSMFLLDNLKDIIQSESLDSKALEKVPKMLRCLECDLSNQGQEGSAVMSKVREIRQMLASKLSVRPSSRQASVNQFPTTSQRSTSPKEIPNLPYLLTELQKIDDDLKKDIQFKSCNLNSAILCLGKLLKDILHNHNLDSQALANLEKVLDGIANTLCEVKNLQSSMTGSLCEMQQLLTQAKASNTGSGRRETASTGAGQGSMAGTAKTMDECIKELESILLDFLPHLSTTDACGQIE